MDTNWALHSALKGYTRKFCHFAYVIFNSNVNIITLSYKWDNMNKNHFLLETFIIQQKKDECKMQGSNISNKGSRKISRDFLSKAIYIVETFF